MPSLVTHIYNIRDLVNGGRANRAMTYGDRQIAQWIRYWRAYLVGANIKKYNYVPQGYEQDLGCLTLTKADKSMCQKYCWGEKVYYVEIPAVLDLPDNMAITYFGLVNKQTRIPLSDYNYGSFAEYSRFSPAQRIYAEKIGNTLYVHGVDDLWALEGVNLRGVFADPANLVTDNGTEILCYDWDTDNYPIPATLESAMYDLIFEKEVGIARTVKADNSDNEVTNVTL